MRVNETEFLIGADPECFIRSKKTGKLVSAHGMLPGDKKNPYKVKYGAVQVDGMAAEFNIEPAKTKKSFIRNVNAVLNTIRKMLGDEYELVFDSVAHFGREMIDAQPQEAKELGCDPDFNAWTGEENPVPNVDTPFRTGAGHIHIGWTSGQDIKDQNHLKICHHLIRNLDYCTSPTALYEEDFTRRELYGKAGAFRPKSYGVEYRTPSNFWLASDELMGWMYDLVTGCIKELSVGEAPIEGSDSYYKKELMATIDKGNFGDDYYYGMYKSTLRQINSLYGGGFDV